MGNLEKFEREERARLRWALKESALACMPPEPEWGMNDDSRLVATSAAGLRCRFHVQVNHSRYGRTERAILRVSAPTWHATWEGHIPEAVWTAIDAEAGK